MAWRRCGARRLQAWSCWGTPGVTGITCGGFGATGMGRRTDHVVQQVWLDLEDSPAQTVTIRYEFRPQLVRLGVLPSAPALDPLRRREAARGFEPEFSPEVPRPR